MKQSLAYFHTRSLIHRPLLCYGSGSSASAATIVLAAAGKHIMQIIELLDERCMNYTFPLNKQNLLLSAGFSILWQCVDLEDDSKLIKDNQKSLMLLHGKLSKENLAAGHEFQKIASHFVAIGSPKASPKHIHIDTPAAQLLNTMPAPSSSKHKTAKKQLQAIASRFTGLTSKENRSGAQPERKSMSPWQHSQNSPYQRNNSTVSLISTQSAPTLVPLTPSPRSNHAAIPSNVTGSVVNLDYFPLEADLQLLATQNSSSTMLPPKKQPSRKASVWEHSSPDYEIVTGLDNTIEPHALSKCISNPETLDWTGDMWNLGSFHTNSHVPQSLLSFSDESLTSGDDFVFSTAGSSHHGSMSTHESMELPLHDDVFKGITIPVSSIEDELDFSPAVQV